VLVKINDNGVALNPNSQLYPCYLEMRDFSKPRSVPNARPEMIGVVIPHLHFITTHGGMDAGARATQEQLPVGRLSPCPAGLFTQRKWVGKL